MAFSYEEIDRARIQELVNTIRPPRILSMSSIQVIDREHDAIFIELGGRGELPPERNEPPTFYALWWKGNRIFFSGHDQQTFPQGMVEVDIKLVELLVPHALQNHEAEIQQLIVEAMTSYWSGIRRRQAIVRVSFPTPEFY